MMTPDFRPATAADIPCLVTLRHERSQAERSPFDADLCRSALYELLFQSQWGRIWVIDAGGTIVGYVLMTVGFSVELGGRYGFFDEMYVQESHRGQDLGARSLEVVETACRALGLSKLMVGVSSSHVRAQATWRHVGFGDGPFQLMLKPLQPDA